MSRFYQNTPLDINTKKRGAIFLDRDGVINYEKRDYVKNVSEFKFIEGAIEGVGVLSTLALPIVIITNQSAVGRGLLTLQELNKIHTYMTEKIQENGGELTTVYFCPHTPEEHCDCRKPKIGLFRQAEIDLQISLESSWFFGDKPSDEQAGKAAGCKTVLIESNAAFALLRASKEFSKTFHKAPP